MCQWAGCGLLGGRMGNRVLGKLVRGLIQQPSALLLHFGIASAHWPISHGRACAGLPGAPFMPLLAGTLLLAAPLEVSEGCLLATRPAWPLQEDSGQATCPPFSGKQSRPGAKPGMPVLLLSHLQERSEQELGVVHPRGCAPDPCLMEANPNPGLQPILEHAGAQAHLTQVVQRLSPGPA